MTASIFSNVFGEVSSDRIVFNAKKSLFSGSVREDFPIRHITSVRFETKRHPILGAVLVIAGLIFLKSLIVALILIGIGAYLLIGSPSVSINSAGGEQRISVGTPFSGQEAQQYVAAVREALFSKESA